MDLNLKSHNILLSAFLCYNRFYVKTKVNIVHMRNKYSFFNIICECIDMCIQAMYAVFHWLTHSRIEPSDPAWICICKYVPKASLSNAEIDEEYFRFDKKVLNDWPTRVSDFSKTKNDPAGSIWDIYHYSYKTPTSFLRHFAFIIQFLRSFLSPKLSQSKYQEAFDITMCCGNISDTLVIARVCPTAVRIRIMENMILPTTQSVVSPANCPKPADDLLELKLSDLEFVEVEFRCGDGPGIPIEIPKSHYIIGNDILSKTYILRYLEHNLPNYSRWEFDEFTYSVRIMDSEFNVFSISGDQYIRITESSHKIIENIKN